MLLSRFLIAALLGAAASAQSCIDSTTFTDEMGGTCADWVGYDCSTAASYGYSAAGVRQLNNNCCATCSASSSSGGGKASSGGKNTGSSGGKNTGSSGGKNTGSSGGKNTGGGGKTWSWPTPAPVSSGGASACADVAGFTDEMGGSCSDWAGYDCTTATMWGYSATGQSNLVANCCASCGGSSTTGGGKGGSTGGKGGWSTPAPVSSGGASACVDVAGFTDEKGATCSDWAGYDCSLASSNNYTPRGARQLLSNCCASCSGGASSGGKGGAGGKGGSSGSCVDVAGYSGPKGTQCSDWAGYDCSTSSISASDSRQLIANCCASCSGSSSGGKGGAGGKGSGGKGGQGGKGGGKGGAGVTVVDPPNGKMYLVPHAAAFSAWNDFILLVSDDCSSSNPCPVVINMHGLGGNGNGQMMTAIGDPASSQVFASASDAMIWAFPKSLGMGWDHSNEEEWRMLESIYDYAIANYDVDTNYLYLSGYSSGGFMTLRGACDASLRFRLAGLITYAGLGKEADAIGTSCDRCRSHELNMMLVHGTYDDIVLWGGPANNPELCGPRQMAVSLAESNGCPVSSEEKHCGLNCDQYEGCFELNGSGLLQTDGFTSAYNSLNTVQGLGACQTDGSMILSGVFAWCANAKAECGSCYPDSPCGTNDGLYPDGGYGATSEATRKWSMDMTSLVAGSETDVYEWSGSSCDTCSTTTRLYRINGLDHGWPGTAGKSGGGLSAGGVSPWVTEAIDFVKNNPRVGCTKADTRGTVPCACDGIGTSLNGQSDFGATCQGVQGGLAYGKLSAGGGRGMMYYCTPTNADLCMTAVQYQGVWLKEWNTQAECQQSAVDAMNAGAIPPSPVTAPSSPPGGDYTALCTGLAQKQCKKNKLCSYSRLGCTGGPMPTLTKCSQLKKLFDGTNAAERPYAQYTCENQSGVQCMLTDKAGKFKCDKLKCKKLKTEAQCLAMGCRVQTKKGAFNKCK